MAKVLLGVTGSVAAVRTVALAQALCQAGHEVQVLATQPALYFFEAQELAQLPNPVPLVLDADEWPGRAIGEKYQRGAPVLHIELRRWAELFLVAPLDANTLAKFAYGLCDNCLTSVWRALPVATPKLLAPAMNTLMWEHPVTRLHWLRLAEQWADTPPTPSSSTAECLAWLNQRSATLRVVPPQTKALACGDVGLGAMAEVHELVAQVEGCLRQ